MIDQATLEASLYTIKTTSSSDEAALKLHRQWTGNRCTLSIENAGERDVQLDEVVAFRFKTAYPSSTPVYGEGYNMLSQYKGSLESQENITPHSDYGHYKLPQAQGFFTAYNFLLITPESSAQLLGFSSCRRFTGLIRYNPQEVCVVIDGEGKRVKAGETLELEEFCLISSNNREEALAEFGTNIQAHHPALAYPSAPTGWCSWYCYGPDVTEQDIFDNLEQIKKDMPELEFIQLDDGYQKTMGDWLIPHENFPNGIQSLCLKIKEAGFEPAIWVAPFIAEKDSELFQQHPDWFVKNEEGQPLCSSDVTFGGWRCGPWYMLDGTHPEARDYLKKVFSTMREEWQCRYFKLDANVWGALPFGQRFEENATCVEAYRAGMEAIVEAAGEDSFILGCNAPMWPSIGVVHGMRNTGDIFRRWETFKELEEQCFHRNWQHNRLWINDPDCVVLNNLEISTIGPDGKPTHSKSAIQESEFAYHATHILASGGMVLGSDIMMELNESHQRVLRKLLAAGNHAATFLDASFKIGRIDRENDHILCLFNSGDTEVVQAIEMEPEHVAHDFWNDEKVSGAEETLLFLTLPPHSARALLFTKSGS